MAYFKITNRSGVTTDYSMYVNKLLVTTKHKYTARENASGTMMVKYITKKRTIQVGVIPLDAEALKNLIADINSFKVSVEYLDPQTNALQTISCIIPVNSVEYYTIQVGKTMSKAFNFNCEEL